MTIDQALALVRKELERAEARFAPFNSRHEGYAVILEEVDELWDDVKANRPTPAAYEAVQVAAMGLRYLVNLVDASELEAYIAGKVAARKQREVHPVARSVVVAASPEPRR